jgi:hypothetical protein
MSYFIFLLSHSYPFSRAEARDVFAARPEDAARLVRELAVWIDRPDGDSP